MKKIFILFFVFVITSCKKNSTSPIIIPAPKFISISLSADSIWYQSATTISWSTSDATKVDITNGSNVVLSGGASSGSFPTPILTGNITYTFTATGAGGTASKTADIHVLSATMTLLGWDESRKQIAKWQMFSEVINGVPVTKIDCDKYSYLKNNTIIDITSCGTTYPIGTIFTDGYQLSTDEKMINLGLTYNPPNVFNIDNISESTLQLS